MRFKKGGKVEVLIKKEVPPGEWHCARIISDNGRTYSVVFEGPCSMGSEALVERVPRKAIRPFPPVGSVESWVVGDVVEVFDVGSWKIAMVSKVLGRDYYLARLLGSHEEFKVHKSNIRVRQSWQDNEWFVIGRGQGSCEVVKSDKPSSLNCHHMTSEFPQFNTRRKMQTGNNCVAAQDNTCFQESHIVSSRTLKRFSPYFSSHIEANTRKMRGIQKEGEHRRLISESVSPLLEKVDAVAYPRVNLGETYMHASSNNETGYFELERGNQNGSIFCFHERSSEPIDCGSVSSSVGSCSVVSDSPNKLSGHILSGHTQDADSFDNCGYEEGKCLRSMNENVAARIHILELHAYRCTLEAIYASGSLSWEQEALLTNLRISLNISNDEHLMEIRNLKSA
ncbi:hypothetical protein F2P56_026150 [Juglans regia]|uniref:Uncharacterized protein LOC109001809 isoform X1 n=2 Tax=Juglans regia TaxID=51240 RepID=A0A2I4FT18_JUGRE|nr:uncharacterized protein LOC109001809 isoform X1 [Juglans regia]KAF5456703.1 hypothetical protein F2P56_026150 [Juglans regia]